MYIFILQDLFIVGLLIFSTASCNLWVRHGNAESTFDVLQYGAKGDGHTDDTQVIFFYNNIDAQVNFFLIKYPSNFDCYIITLSTVVNYTHKI